MDNTGYVKWIGLQSELANIVSSLMRKHTRFDWIIRFVTLVIPFLILSAVLLQPWYDKRPMFLDTITAAEFSDMCCRPYFGFVSNLGIFLWVSTSAICIFSATLIYSNKVSDWRLGFALTAGLFTGWLALDDAFLLHERVLPSIGISQNSVLAFYALLAAFYFYLNRRIILKFDFWLLAMGVAGFVVSLAIDVIFHSVESTLVYMEDSAKFFAIFCWLSFHVSSCWKLLGQVQNNLSHV